MSDATAVSFFTRWRRKIFGPSWSEQLAAYSLFLKNDFEHKAAVEDKRLADANARYRAARDEEDRLWAEWHERRLQRATEFGKWIDANGGTPLHKTGEPFWWKIPWGFRTFGATLITGDPKQEFPITRPEDNPYNRIPELEELTAWWIAATST